MTLTEIRNAVISRMAAQTAIASDAVDYPNGPVFDPSNRDIWARLTNIAGQAGATEIGDGPVIHRTGLLIIQLFVPVGSGTLLISRTADQLRPAPLPQRLKSPLPRLNLPGPFCSHRGSGFFGSLYADYFFSN